MQIEWIGGTSKLHIWKMVSIKNAQFLNMKDSSSYGGEGSYNSNDLQR